MLDLAHDLYLALHLLCIFINKWGFFFSFQIDVLTFGDDPAPNGRLEPLEVIGNALVCLTRGSGHPLGPGSLGMLDYVISCAGVAV
jgi:hypothetical protein